jgi:protein-S-isoprenylcysteine O-methyltransferase Ste14
MLLNHIILAMLWIFFCLSHSVLASMTVKKWLKHLLRKKYKFYRLFYSILSFLLMGGIFYYQLSIPSAKMFQTSKVFFLAGIIFTSAGILLMLICIKKYFISLSGLKSLFQETPTNTLIISGVHRYIRHPLYTGTFIFIWGLFILFPFVSLLIANSIITIYTLIGINFEENKLIDEFGAQYIQYKQQVPKLIPSLKSKRIS